MSALFENMKDRPNGMTSGELDITVVIPVRNSASFLEGCLESVVSENPSDIVVVDGNSTDGTLEIARRFPVRVLSDEGAGLPVARRLGVRAASTRLVFLLDSDVVLPRGSLGALIREFERGRYAALQAGLESVGGPGYWGLALAHHHLNGRSRHWFGLVATIFEKKTLLEHDFDDRFISGEDIELRLRLREAGLKCGVSRETTVTHRFLDTRDFALDQFRADGAGLARLLKKNGLRASPWLLAPLAGAARGALRSVRSGEEQWLGYYLRFAIGNYTSMTRTLLSRPKKSLS
jgi:glycosyltransferase involved in cell wall biosynthesis